MAITLTISLAHFGHTTSRTIAYVLPRARTEELEQTLSQGHTLIKEGRASEAHRLAETTSKHLLEEPFTQSLLLSKMQYENHHSGHSHAEGYARQTYQDRNHHSYTHYEETFTRRLVKEMKQERQPGFFTSRAGLNALSQLLDTLSGTTPESSAIKGYFRHRAHQSRDAQRIRERTLMELYARSL